MIAHALTIDYSSQGFLLLDRNKSDPMRDSSACFSNIEQTAHFRSFRAEEPADLHPLLLKSFRSSSIVHMHERKHAYDWHEAENDVQPRDAELHDFA